MFQNKLNIVYYAEQHTHVVLKTLKNFSLSISLWHHQSPDAFTITNNNRLNVFVFFTLFTCYRCGKTVMPLLYCKCKWNKLKELFVLRRHLHANFTSPISEVHPPPNKVQSTALLLYTSWRLACNLPVCLGDLWLFNGPYRRHACNCSGWCNDGFFQYLFIYVFLVKWKATCGIVLNNYKNTVCVLCRAVCSL